MDEARQSWIHLFNKCVSYQSIHYDDEVKEYLHDLNSLIDHPLDDQALDRVRDMASLYATPWEVLAPKLDDPWGEVGDIGLYRIMGDGDTSMQALLAMDLTPPPSYLSNFLLPGSLTLVHAAPGTGKTPFAMQMANAAMGYHNLFNWREGLDLDKNVASKVYYMDGELPQWMLKRNLHANFSPGGNVTTFSAARWYRASHSGLDLQHDTIRDMFRRQLDHHQPDILVLDNRSNFYHGEENSNDDAINLNTFLIEIRDRGIAVIICHHQGKMGQSRGASAITDVMDTVIRLDRVDHGNKDEFRFEVHLEKARMGWWSPFMVTAKLNTDGTINMYYDPPLKHKPIKG